MKYLFIILVLTSCVICPTNKQIDRWRTKGCVTFDTVTKTISKTDTVVKYEYLKDSSYNKTLDSLIDNLPLKDSVNGKSIDNKTKILIKKKVKEEINNFIKKEEHIICSFIKTIEINDCVVFLTFDGINLSTKVKYKQANITISKTNIWTYWHELIWIIIVSILIGAVLALFIRR